MLVFTVKDSAFEGRLKLVDGRFGDMMGDMLAVFLPEVMAKF